MPQLTQILPSKRGPNWHRIYLDGVFAFTLNDNVIARFNLRHGQTLTDDQIDRIKKGEVRQEVFDLALRYLQTRLHSRAEMQRKLIRRDVPEALVAQILDELERLDYLNDARFARTRALAAAQYKHHGRRRTMAELLRAGVPRAVADKALDEVYSEGGVGADPLAAARTLVQKQIPRLKKLAPLVARRRITGMLQRRGFDYDAIKPIIDEVLGDQD